MDGIEDVIAEFEAKMQQVSSADIQIAKGETPAEEAIAEPTGEELACVNKQFKELVEVLPSLYIGTNIKDLLVEFLGTVPECEV